MISAAGTLQYFQARAILNKFCAERTTVGGKSGAFGGDDPVVLESRDHVLWVWGLYRQGEVVGHFGEITASCAGGRGESLAYTGFFTERERLIAEVNEWIAV